MKLVINHLNSANGNNIPLNGDMLFTVEVLSFTGKYFIPRHYVGFFVPS